MAHLGARSALLPPDGAFCGYRAPQLGLRKRRIACGAAMVIGDVAMPYVVGWRPFDDRTGGQKRFGAGEEVDDPRMWATLLEQHRGPPCFCRTRIPSCCVPRGSFTIYFRLFLCLPAPGESRHCAIPRGSAVCKRAEPTARRTGPGRGCAGAEIAIGRGRALGIAQKRSCAYSPFLWQERGKIGAPTPPRRASCGIGTPEREHLAFLAGRPDNRGHTSRPENRGHRQQRTVNGQQ